MSAYLELLEEKNKLGIITNGYLNCRTEWYNKTAKQKIKDNYDNTSERELIRIKANANLYLQTILISKIKEGNKYLDSIKGWVTFFGILQIVSIASVVIYLMAL